jgi:hypothetical protein
MERIQRVLGKPVIRQNRFGPLIIISGLTALSLIFLRPTVLVPARPAPVALQHKTVTPVRYEKKELEISGKAKDLTLEISSRRKHIKMEANPVMQSLPVAVNEESTDAPDMAYYTDNKISRDYSNQPAADLSQDPVQVLPGSPYVPSISLTYDAQPVIIAADSMRNVQIKNEIRTAICLTNLKAIANLKELEIQIDKNKQELSQIEIKNQKLFLLDRRNMKPLLKKIQKQIESKKIQVDALRNKLEVSEAEIIHM